MYVLVFIVFVASVVTNFVTPYLLSSIFLFRLNILIYYITPRNKDHRQYHK